MLPSVLDKQLFNPHFCLPVPGGEGFIVVQGLLDWQPEYENAVDDYNNMYNFFTQYAGPCAVQNSQVVGLTESKASELFDAIDDMVAAGFNQITIYITAFSGNTGVWLGNVWMGYGDLNAKLASHPYTIFNLLLQASSSGYLMDYVPIDFPSPTFIYLVATACRSDELAYMDVDTWSDYEDVNPEDSGSEWTSSLLVTLNETVNDTGRFQEVSEATDDYYFDVPLTSMLLYMASLKVKDSLLDLACVEGYETPQVDAAWLHWQSHVT
jgi:hypothetical protein